MASSGCSSLVDFLELGCAVPMSRRRRRRNKHVNPTSTRNLVKPPPPPPKCKFRQPSLIDPDAWVVLVHCKDDETLHELDEQLPVLAAKAGIEEAILRSHGFSRLVYVIEEKETKAKNLVSLLKSFSAVFVGRTHKPFVRERIVEVHGLPDGIGYEEINEALDCQFPGKSLTFDILVSFDPRREPEREILIVTHDSYMCHQLLSNGGLKLFDDRLTFKCTERSSEAAASAGKWKKKKTKIIPESERQCFKCLNFGHMAESCEAPPRCKHCAGPHSQRECTKSKDDVGNEVVCVNCGSHDHKAASRSCPMRPGSAQKKRAKELPFLEGARGLPSPPPSPENNSILQTSGAMAGGEGEPAGVVTPPSSLDRRVSESFSEDAGEVSTEEPRDSPAMTSPEVNAAVEESESAQETVAGGVSSTTGEAKAAKVTEGASEENNEGSANAVTGSDATEESPKIDSAEEAIEDKSNNEETSHVEEGLKVEDKCENDEAAVENPEDSEDNGDEKKHDAEDGVLYFTGAGKDSEGDTEAPHHKTASAVASFFSDLFGAAEAPSKPLDGNFVATLRSLQESVYNDIASRQPRRGATSPRERKPVKKRRLVGPFVAAAAAAATAASASTNRATSPGAPVLSPISSPEKVLGSPIGRRRRGSVGETGPKASRSVSERRLRVLEQFFHVVSAILDIE